MATPAHFLTPTEVPSPRRRPGTADRVWDLAAVLLISVGVALYFWTRGDASGVGAGARDTMLVRVALWCVASGCTIALAAAMRHFYLERTER